MDMLTLRPLGEERWAWVLHTASGIQSAESPLAAVPRPAAGTRGRLLLPGDWVTHAAVVINAKSPRLIAQALPFALEESIAEEVEQVRIAHGARAADGAVQARVVNRARLDALLVELAAQNVHPDAIFSELDAIPRPHEGWVLLPLTDAVLMCSAEEAMSVDVAWLKDVLAAEAAVHVIDTPSAAAVVAELPAGCALTREPAPQGSLGVAASTFARSGGDRFSGRAGARQGLGRVAASMGVSGGVGGEHCAGAAWFDAGADPAGQAAYAGYAGGNRARGTRGRAGGQALGESAIAVAADGEAWRGRDHGGG